MQFNESQREVGDAEFVGLAKDEARARMLRKMMKNLAEGDERDPLAAMARDVVSGRRGIREAVDGLPRNESLEARFDTFQQRWDAMSESERLAAERESSQYLEEQRREIRAEREAAGHPGAVPPRHRG
ncbi:hypothetical protein OHT20_09705 [Streptomyces caniferus]|uniref:Uncharacterized protein n=1 Tax=Streptomyces caniferus TaxID=285557 RepID=A0ABZ1VGS8_9ACTN|nr:hypothetical protein [Streptomyces caniferus]